MTGNLLFCKEKNQVIGNWLFTKTLSVSVQLLDGEVCPHWVAI
jgi:hypothetical protein